MIAFDSSTHTSVLTLFLVRLIKLQMANKSSYETPRLKRWFILW